MFIILLISVKANTYPDNCSTNPSDYYVYDDFENIQNTTYWIFNATYFSFNNTISYSGTYSAQCSSGNAKTCLVRQTPWLNNTCALVYISSNTIDGYSAPTIAVNPYAPNYLVVIDNGAGGGTADKYNYYNGAWGTYGVKYSTINSWDRILICVNETSSPITNANTEFYVNITNSSNYGTLAYISNVGGGGAFSSVVMGLNSPTNAKTFYDKYMEWNMTKYGKTCPPPTALPEANNNIVGWISQTPDNITTTNTILTNLSVVYNMTQTALSSAYINYTLNTTFGNGQYWILTNRSIERQGWITTDFTYTNISNIFTFINEADNYLPATYNIQHDTMINTTHNTLSLSNGNTLASYTIYNMSSTALNPFFEIMLNTTGTCNVYYCNETYTTGTPVTNTNCALVKTMINTTTFNHTHGINSRHNIIPLTINNSKIGNVAVTTTSYIIIKQFSGVCDIGYIPIFTDVNADRTSSNNGNTWTSQTYSFDAHLHEFLAGIDYIKYYGCSQNSTTLLCENITHTDIFDKTSFNPLPVTWINPAKNGTIHNYTNNRDAWINLQYTTGIPNGNTTITYYTISLYDTSYNLLSLIQNNSLNLTYNFTLYGLAVGEYKIGVRDYDSNGLYADSFTDIIELGTNVSYQDNITFISPTPINNALLNDTNTMMVNVSLNFASLNCEFMYENGIGLWLSMTEFNTTEYWYNVSSLYPLPYGVSWYQARCENDTAWIYSENRTINVSFIPPCAENWVAYNTSCISNSRLMIFYEANMCNTTTSLPVTNGTYQACISPPSQIKLSIDNNLLLLMMLIIGFFASIIFAIKSSDIETSIFYVIASFMLIMIALTSFIYINTQIWIYFIIIMFLTALFFIYYAIDKIIKFYWR